MDINDLIAIVKKKLQNQINIESIKTITNLNSILESISQKKLPIKTFVNLFLLT